MNKFKDTNSNRFQNTTSNRFTQSHMIADAVDGVKFGDSPTRFAHYPVEASDGVKFGDTPDATCTFYVELEDGVKFGEALQEYFVELLQDGIKFGDYVINLGPRSELETFAEVNKVWFNFQARLVNFKHEAISKPLEQTLSAEDVFVLTPAKKIEFAIKAKPIPFKFKAFKKDYNQESS